jgi:hypothetical protein
MSRILHVLWSPQSGPICAYEDPTLAWEHARVMLGVDVAQVEFHDVLPEVVRDDVASDYNGEEITPVEPVDDRATAIAIDDIDDAPKK